MQKPEKAHSACEHNGEVRSEREASVRQWLIRPSRDSYECCLFCRLACE